MASSLLIRSLVIRSLTSRGLLFRDPVLVALLGIVSDLPVVVSRGRRVGSEIVLGLDGR
jgi:hypothetical protein